VKIADSAAAYREEDLTGHLANGNGSGDEQSQAPTPTPQPVVSAEDVLVQDYQLNEALNLLKGINALEAVN
jgi:carboxyl-terminal processing protease